MSELKSLILILVLSALTSFKLSAQAGMLTGGGEARSDFGHASYSVGQVFFKVLSGPAGSVDPSIQQSFQSGTVDAHKLRAHAELDIRVYPNPGRSPVLSMNDPRSHDLSYQLYTPAGQLIRSERVIDPLTAIAIGQYRTGWLVLKVLNKQSVLKTIKIIINQ